MHLFKKTKKQGKSIPIDQRIPAELTSLLFCSKKMGLCPSAISALKCSSWGLLPIPFIRLTLNCSSSFQLTLPLSSFQHALLSPPPSVSLPQSPATRGLRWQSPNQISIKLAHLCQAHRMPSSAFQMLIWPCKSVRHSEQKNKKRRWCEIRNVTSLIHRLQCCSQRMQQKAINSF